jgi:hypothetical protein
VRGRRKKRAEADKGIINAFKLAVGGEERDITYAKMWKGLGP